MRFNKVQTHTTFFTDNTGRVTIELCFEDATRDEMYRLKMGLDEAAGTDSMPLPGLMNDKKNERR